MTGFGGATAYGYLIGETRSSDIHGNVTTSATYLDTANRKQTTITDFPDSAADAESITQYGLLKSEKSKTGREITYGYDSLGRKTTITDLTLPLFQYHV